MSTRGRIGLPRLLPIAVSAGVLVWLLHGVDLHAVAARVNRARRAVMIPALIAFCAVTLWIEAVSIHRLRRAPAADFGSGPPRGSSARATCPA
jgi:hypothetical protein